MDQNCNRKCPHQIEAGTHIQKPMNECLLKFEFSSSWLWLIVEWNSLPSWCCNSKTFFIGQAQLPSWWKRKLTCAKIIHVGLYYSLVQCKRIVIFTSHPCEAASSRFFSSVLQFVVILVTHWQFQDSFLRIVNQILELSSQFEWILNKTPKQFNTCN